MGEWENGGNNYCSNDHQSFYSWISCNVDFIIRSRLLARQCIFASFPIHIKFLVPKHLVSQLVGVSVLSNKQQLTAFIFPKRFSAKTRKVSLGTIMDLLLGEEKNIKWYVININLYLICIDLLKLAELFWKSIK